MKLRNKKTGEIVIKHLAIRGNNEFAKIYNSLAELNEEWEDYEEDELLYVVSAEHRSGYQCVLKEDYPEICKVAKELGIGFESEKECRKAVEKLKAWKRLEDKGFDFVGCFKDNTINYEFVERPLNYDESEEAEQDLAFLFGGEE